MSFEAAAWAINRRTRTATAKLVLIGLADCHNRDTGQCDPGNTHLSNIAQCTKRSVINAIEELEALGYITTQKSNGRRTNYKLNLNVKQCNQFTGENIAPVKSAHEPVKYETPTGENDNSSFSIEPVRTSKQTSKTLRDSRGGEKIVKASDDDYSLACKLLAGIRRLKPDYKQPNLDTWADDVRKMRELDGRNHFQIFRVFDWANHDSFWQTNILSPAKLREKFDQLELQMTRPKAQGQSQSPSQRRTRDVSVMDQVNDHSW